ncbi:MAG: orotidine-5'-phosphate decarboxylase [Bacteroidota bacterium]
MNRKELFAFIKSQQSFLCVGLDTDLKRIPKSLLSTADPIFDFNKAIIDATKDLCIAYKPNIAFYESLGSKGWTSLEKTIEYIPDTHFTIADAKRGDIGNTSKMYASAFFNHMDFDSITVAPYMGVDSVTPFLEFENKWVILLALTSNKGSQDFQFFNNGQSNLYEQVLTHAQKWGNTDNLMFVVGATHPEKFKGIRAIIPDHFLLVPGVGAQGGDLKSVSDFGMNDHCGLIVNSSRGIIYASSENDFAEAARAKAQVLQSQMAAILADRF